MLIYDLLKVQLAISSDGHELPACQTPEPLPGIYSKQITKTNTDHQI